MRTKVLSVVIVVGLVVLALAARYQLSGHRVPAGQPSLGELTSGSLDSLQAEFNRSADSVRIVLLLSPT
jgi:hypothetical protein